MNTATANRCDTILLGEDEPEIRDSIETQLKLLGYSVETASREEEILSVLEERVPEISAVILDITEPERGRLEAIAAIRRSHFELPVIVVSGEPSTLQIVRAMKLGAADYLTMPVSDQELDAALGRALDRRGGADATSLRTRSAPAGAFLGRSPRMAEIWSLAEQVGWSEAPVLIQGETGSGKEVLARELHARSPRANRPFLKLNCAALPSELVESELFGYERGAFTGAMQRKPGMFEMADGGSILLDEIGDMDVRLQAKLLQVLQDHEFQRIGGRETIKVDVRVMAATHRDLEAAIRERTFREDLYYRLNVINLVLPPLRERPEDIIPLTDYLMRKHTPAGSVLPRMTRELESAMLEHGWPGNVRELENMVRKFLILRDPDLLARELLERASRRRQASAPSAEPPLIGPPALAGGTPIFEQMSKAQERAETDAILVALESTRWNRKRASALLGLDYKALLYKMKKLGIENGVEETAAQEAPTAAAASAGIGD